MQKIQKYKNLAPLLLTSKTGLKINWLKTCDKGNNWKFTKHKYKNCKATTFPYNKANNY